MEFLHSVFLSGSFVWFEGVLFSHPAAPRLRIAHPNLKAFAIALLHRPRVKVPCSSMGNTYIYIYITSCLYADYPIKAPL